MQNDWQVNIMLKKEGDSIVETQQINKVFNEATPDEKIALDQINLHLKPGDFVTVIGSNGAGKSTMMNMISGALTPDFGVIEIAGENVVKLPEYKRSTNDWAGLPRSDGRNGSGDDD